MSENPTLVIDWEPIGTGGKARLIVTDETGQTVDIDTTDLSRTADREAVARRLASRLPNRPMADIQAHLLGIAQQRCGLALEPPSRVPTLRDAIAAWRATEVTPVVETGFGPLDALGGGGLALGSVTVIAAPPSVGKSAFGLQAALGAVSLDASLHVAWAAGEMSMEAIARRAICRWSADKQPVSMSGAAQRTRGSQQIADELLAAVADRFHIVQPPLTADSMEAAIAATAARLVVIDYIQLVSLAGATDRRAEVDGLVKRVRAFTLEKNTATVVVSNVAKNVTGETRIGGIGKESSELDFMADLFLLGIADDHEDANGLRHVRWKVAKNRHGPCQDLETVFDGRLQTFTPAAAQPLEEFADFAPRPTRKRK
jgi:replicative DNA helicase